MPLHLIRHGEVLNPRGIVYAGLDGFGLSPAGHAQAAAAGAHLGRKVDLIVSSPLQRAEETASHVAAASGAAVVTDERLTEWSLADRWAGVPWVELSDCFPGELEAYAAHPQDLPFSPESLTELSRRVTAAIDDFMAAAATVAIVSHQDPIQAARLSLTGRPLDLLQRDKPVHAGIITLFVDGPAWREVAHWKPPTPSAPFPPLEDTG